MPHASGSVSHGPFRELEDEKITPTEYAERVRREVRELIRESPRPARPEKSEKKTER